jgi:hypothetical protein
LPVSVALLGLEFHRVLPFSVAEEERLLRAAATESPAVYVIRHSSFGLGERGIAYIGRATGRFGLRARLDGYFPGPSQWTNRRILAPIKALDGHDIVLRPVLHPRLAELFEYRLLTKFVATFGRLPPYNRTMPAAPDLTGVRIVAGGSSSSDPTTRGAASDTFGADAYVIGAGDIEDADAEEAPVSDVEMANAHDEEPEDQKSELADYDSDGAEIGADPAEGDYQGYGQRDPEDPDDN